MNCDKHSDDSTSECEPCQIQELKTVNDALTHRMYQGRWKVTKELEDENKVLKTEMKKLLQAIAVANMIMKKIGIGPKK